MPLTCACHHHHHHHHHGHHHLRSPRPSSLLPPPSSLQPNIQRIRPGRRHATWTSVVGRRQERGSAGMGQRREAMERYLARGVGSPQARGTPAPHQWLSPYRGDQSSDDEAVGYDTIRSDRRPPTRFITNDHSHDDDAKYEMKRNVHSSATRPLGMPSSGVANTRTL